MFPARSNCKYVNQPCIKSAEVALRNIKGSGKVAGVGGERERGMSTKETNASADSDSAKAQPNVTVQELRREGAQTQNK